MLKNFNNFKSIKALRSNSIWECIPEERGVYIVASRSLIEPNFRKRGSGGFFKGKDPNVPIDKLKAKWVDFSLNKEGILYIGKAGGKNTLKNRIRSFIRFGLCRPTAHWGGRYIWQLVKPEDLLIFWKKNKEPESGEKTMLKEFRKCAQKLPFANLRM